MSVRTILALFVSLVATWAIAQDTGSLPDTPAGEAMAHVLAVFGHDETAQLDADRFSESFLRQVPAASLNQVPLAIRAQFGPLGLTTIEKQDESSMVVACRGATSGLHVRLSLRLDEAGKIEGLLLRPAPELDRPDDSWNTVIEDLNAQGARTSLGVFRLNEGEIEAIRVVNADEPLAVGSTFKLYILGALAEMIGEGQTSWSDMLAIRDELKSHPGGVMQNDQAGTEHPLRQYALKMISISDNTATDHLFDLVGRERVEAYMARLNEHAGRSTPFMSTREMFTIKLNADPSVAQRYAEANEAERRAILADEGIFGGELPPLDDPTKGWLEPRFIDSIEWFISTRDAARLMADLYAKSEDDGNEPLSEILGTNPGVAIDRSTWPAFFYKGGSEPGAINMTWLLERKDGEIFVISLSVNDDENVPEVMPLASIAARAISLLGENEG